MHGLAIVSQLFLNRFSSHELGEAADLIVFSLRRATIIKADQDVYIVYIEHCVYTLNI